MAKELFPDHPNSGDQENPPIFIKLHHENFENWIIAIEEIVINPTASFSYSIVLCPSNISDEEITRRTQELEFLIGECVVDILERCVTALETKESTNVRS